MPFFKHWYLVPNILDPFLNPSSRALLPQYNSLGRCGLVDLLDVFDLLEGDGDLLDVFDLLEGDGDLLDLEGGGPHSFSNSLYFGPFFFIFLFVSGFTRGCECHVAHLLAIYYMSKMCTV
jgi:hypothetical protein